MNTFQIILSYEYISKFKLTWSDIIFGINNGFFTEDTAIKYAVFEITNNKDSSEQVMNIASLFLGESIYPFINEIAEQESLNENISKKKLLFFLLNWLFENKEQFSDPLEMIEVIYADFDYLDEISNFVGYMPAEKGSKETGEKYLLSNWEKYLNKYKKLYLI